MGRREGDYEEDRFGPGRGEFAGVSRIPIWQEAQSMHEHLSMLSHCGRLGESLNGPGLATAMAGRGPQVWG